MCKSNKALCWIALLAIFLISLTPTGSLIASGIQQGGGGAVITTSGQGYVCPLSCTVQIGGSPAFSAKVPRYLQFVLRDTLKVTRLGGYISTADSTPIGNCGGAACGFAAALYDSTCTKVAGSDLTTSQTLTNAPHLYNFGTPVTLSPGVFQLGFTSDSTTVQFYGSDASTIVTTILNLQGSSLARYYQGATLATGNNSTLAMPASCGALTAIGGGASPEYFIIFP